jgi:hypothetical protein
VSPVQRAVVLMTAQQHYGMRVNASLMRPVISAEDFYPK